MLDYLTCKMNRFFFFVALLARLLCFGAHQKVVVMALTPMTVGIKRVSTFTRGLPPVLPPQQRPTAAAAAAAMRFVPRAISSSTLHMVMEDFSVFDDEFNDDDNNMSGQGGEEEEELSDEELLAMAGEWDDKIARYNTVHLTGRIGSDPEAKYLDNGKVVVNVSLASRRKYHVMERVVENIRSYEDEETEWYGLEIWGQTAEFVAQYVDKGARVGVIGSLQIDQWNDNATGELRQRAKIIVRDLDLLETRAEAEARRQNRGRNTSSTTGSSSGGGGGYGDDGNNNDGYSSAGTGGFFG